MLVSGVLFGLTAPLSKIAATAVSFPLGLSLWVSAITAMPCLALTARRRRWPRWNPPLARFVFLWGLIGMALAAIAPFQSARFLPATTLAIVLVPS